MLLTLIELPFVIKILVVSIFSDSLTQVLLYLYLHVGDEQKHFQNKIDHIWNQTIHLKNSYTCTRGVRLDLGYLT